MKLAAKILTMFLAVMLTITAWASRPEWITLTGAHQITSMAEANGVLWVGFKGGLTSIDLQTGNRTYYTLANSGLPSTQVEAVAISPTGDIWIGTYDQGLARFDGTTWEVFNNSNSNFSAHQIYTMQFDQNGTLWIGSLLELISYDGQNFTTYPLPGYIAATSLLINSPTDIIMAWDMHNTDLLHFNGTGIDTFAAVPHGIYCLKKDSQGQIWAGYDGGIARYLGNGTWEEHDSTAGITGGIVRDMAWWNGDMYIGTDAGIFKRNGNTWMQTTLQAPHTNRLLAIGNELYVGSRLTGLYKTDGQTMQPIRASESNVPYNSFNSGIRLADDRLLLSTGSNTPLVTFDGNNWGALSNTNSIYGYQMMQQAPNGVIWIFSYQNLYKVDGASVTTWNMDAEGMPQYGYNDMAIGPDGKIYLSTYNDGFVTFNGTTFTNYTRANSGLPSDKVHGFAFSGNTVYMGTYVERVQTVNYGGGLVAWDGASSFTNYNTSNSGIVSNYISQIIVQGNRVIAGGDGGFSVFENGAFTNYGLNYGNAPFAYLNLLRLDDNGHLWIAGVGLNSDYMISVWNNGQVLETFDTTNGPKNLSQYGLGDIVFDKSGNTWLLHSSGTYIYKAGGVTGVEDSIGTGMDAPADLSIRVYPNPVSNALTVDLTDTGTYRLDLYDMSGRKILSQNVQHHDRVDVSSLGSGYIIYQLLDESGVAVERGKLLKL